MKDDNGQLIVISGFIIAIGLVMLTIMLNSAIYSGNIAYEGSMDAQNNGINNLNQLTYKEVNNAYYNASSSGSFNQVKYNAYMDSYSRYVSLIYALSDDSVQVAYNPPFDQTNRMANANIGYTDVDALYQNNANIGIFPKSLSNSLTTPVSGTPTALGVVVGDTYRDANGQVNVTKSTTVQFTVALIDQTGREINTVNIPIYVSATNGTISPATQPQLTTSSGYASFTISNNNMPGVCTVTVMSPGLTSATFRVKFY